MADVKPVTFEQLAEIANRVSPEYATRLLALAGKESTFGKNPAAYKLMLSGLSALCRFYPANWAANTAILKSMQLLERPIR